MEISKMLRLMVSRRWWVTTLIVLVGIGVSIRLGFWQVARYHENKNFAKHLTAMQTASTIILSGENSRPSLTGMEYRAVQATGTYDFTTRSRSEPDLGAKLGKRIRLHPGHAAGVCGWFGGPGRSWLDPDQGQYAGFLAGIRHPGQVTITGVMRLPAVLEMGGEADPTLVPGQNWLDLWNDDRPGEVAKTDALSDPAGLYSARRR